MNQGQPAYTLYVGIDVAATTVSVAVMSPGQLMRPVFTIEQTEPGITTVPATLVIQGGTARQAAHW